MNKDDKEEYIWYNKLLHREEGPAVIYISGTKFWWVNGLKHRLDGPAIIRADGTKYWYLNGIEVDGGIYKKIQECINLNELKKYKNSKTYKNYLPLINHKLKLLKNKFEVDIFFNDIFQLKMASESKKIKKQDILNFIKNMTFEDFKNFLIKNIKDVAV